MVKEDSLISLLPLEKGTGVKLPSEVSLPKAAQQQFIKVVEGTTRTFVNAYLCVKSPFYPTKRSRERY